MGERAGGYGRDKGEDGAGGGGVRRDGNKLKSNETQWPSAIDIGASNTSGG